jgi:hypothetical protein
MKKKVLFLVIIVMFVSSSTMFQKAIYGTDSGNAQAGILLELLQANCGGFDGLFPAASDAECDSCSCVDRFLDNNDGTVTDCRTGLFWLKDANCYNQEDWDNATLSAAGLNHGDCELSDGSAKGDWRLPTKEEAQGIGTDPTTTWNIGSPPDTWTMPSVPFIDVQSDTYWTSTTTSDPIAEAWHLNMESGYSDISNKDTDRYVWPVRLNDCIDIDQDGVCGDLDDCPDSNFESIIVIDDCYTEVENELLRYGCTMNDLIDDCADNVKNHGRFVSCVSRLTNNWKADELITGREKGAIQRCAAKSDIPNDDDNDSDSDSDKESDKDKDSGREHKKGKK